MPSLMACRLPILVPLLLLLARLTLGIHFTNEEWDVEENQKVLITWEYDVYDVLNLTDSYTPVIWIGGNDEPFTYSTKYSTVIYNGTWNPNGTTNYYNWTVDCTLNLTVGSTYASGIGFRASNASDVQNQTISNTWRLQAGSDPCHPTSSGLSTGAKIGIGVGVGVAGLCIIGAAGFGFWYWKRRRDADLESEYDSSSPSHSMELDDRPQIAAPTSYTRVAKTRYSRQY